MENILDNFDDTPIQYARLEDRIIATLIDYGFFYFFIFVYIVYFGEEVDNKFVVNGFELFPIIIAWFVYFVAIESYYSATVGHQIMRLYVLKESGREITFLNTFARRLFDPIDILWTLGLLGFFVALSNEKNQRVGDLVAKTMVLKDKE